MMRITRIIIIGIVSVTAFLGCLLLGLGGGNIAFAGTPGYDVTAQELYFAAEFRREGLRGSEVSIDYEILRGSTLITSGSALAGTFDETLNAWVTGEVRVSLPQAEYGGRTITISLDPEGRLTSPTVLMDNRETTVSIPQP